jgi:cytochrome c
LASLKGNWTPENLDQFLASPQQFAKGTRMAFTGLKKPAERADLIAFLQSVAGGSK